MTYYLNFKNNTVSLDEALDKNARLIEMEELCNIAGIDHTINKAAQAAKAAEAAKAGSLAVDLDLFIEKEALKIMDIAKRCTTYDDLQDFILGEGDFLDPLLEDEFNIVLDYYPDVRCMQIEAFDDLKDKLILNS